MKRLLLLLPILAGAALLSGCAVDEPVGAVAGGPVYHGYYGGGYYNETPPGTYYGPDAYSGPYYGGGTVAVVRTDVHERNSDRDYYVRDGRRYAYRGHQRDYGQGRYTAGNTHGNYSHSNGAVYGRGSVQTNNQRYSGRTFSRGGGYPAGRGATVDRANRHQVNQRVEQVQHDRQEH